MQDSISCFAWLFYVMGRCSYEVKSLRAGRTAQRCNMLPLHRYILHKNKNGGKPDALSA